MKSSLNRFSECKANPLTEHHVMLGKHTRQDLLLIMGKGLDKIEVICFVFILKSRVQLGS